MINVEEALQLVVNNTVLLKPVRHSIIVAQNGVLAEDIKSPIDSPPFSQSSMDGYAICFDDLKKISEFKILGVNMAGTDSGLELQKGSAIRIFTGAMLPSGADTIVVQENTIVKNDRLTILDTKSVKRNAFVRHQGQQTEKNKIALPKGHRLHAGSIGYLTSLGVNKVTIVSRPRISILTTGDELQIPGKKLKPAQIYESNSYTLQALLHEMHFENPDVTRVKDDPEELYTTFKSALAKNEVLIITGGVSVGDYDFVALTLERLNVKKIFHTVAQKPGKPFYFGTFKEKLIFALPGNPASVMVCFYEYIYPALRKMTGHQDFSLPSIKKTCTTDYAKKPGLVHFLKGLVHDDHVAILEGQESFLLSSFAIANCLVVLPASSTGVKAGDKVNVQMIQHR